MTSLKQQCIYACGPYKDYWGRAEYDEEAKIFHGNVVGTRDVVTFQGRTPDELQEAFVSSVNDYLAFCKELGDEPEKPYSGKFVTRLPPELHKRISVLAQAAGTSLNKYVVDCLEKTAHGGHQMGCDPPSASESQSRRRANERPADRAAKKTRRRA
jgi:predicted HicB family RNase H-like nuclease